MNRLFLIPLYLVVTVISTACCDPSRAIKDAAKAKLAETYPGYALSWEPDSCKFGAPCQVTGFNAETQIEASVTIICQEGMLCSVITASDPGGLVE